MAKLEVWHNASASELADRNYSAFDGGDAFKWQIHVPQKPNHSRVSRPGLYSAYIIFSWVSNVQTYLLHPDIGCHNLILQILQINEMKIEIFVRSDCEQRLLKFSLTVSALLAKCSSSGKKLRGFGNFLGVWHAGQLQH